MSDRFAPQKQLQLLKNIACELEKRAIELRSYQQLDLEAQHSSNENTQENRLQQCLEKGAAPSSSNSSIAHQHTNRDVDAITEVSILENLLFERLAFFEEQLLPQGPSIPQGQLSLLRRALLTLQYMQTILEQYQHLPPAVPQSPRISSSTEAVKPPPNGTPDAAYLSVNLYPTKKESLSRSPLHPMPCEQGIPLSFAQQRVWFLEQLDPGKSHYNDYVALRLKGTLNIDALEQSFNEITRRHEILRTTFPNTGGETLQHISPWHPQRLVLIDLQDMPKEERAARARRMAEVEIEQPFDFINGCLLKVRLFQLAEEDHLLITIYHHIIGDGWSMSVLYHELSVLYEAYCVGESSPLVELPIQYADYTLWQHEWLQGKALQEQIDYWRLQLKDAPAQLNLPTDRSRPAVQTYAGSQQTLLLPPKLLQQLKALSQHENVTLFMTLLAAFQVLLMRYSGQYDICVGSPIANRTRRELEGLIGFFANTLVLRTDLSGNPSFQQLLGRVQEMALQAYAHQDLPFEKLVADLEPERDLSRQSLFQVALVFHNFSSSAFELPGVSWSPFELTKATSRFDLLMALNEEKAGLLTTIEYSTDLFEAATIERFLRHWQVLLEAIVHDATGSIENLPLLSEAERRQQLQEWNMTSPAIVEVHRRVTGEPIQQLFERQVQRRAEVVALVFEEQQLTYEALNRHANQLAHYLQQLGVRPDVLVGVCMERSLELVISLLAILKAGGAYVPFDPSYPRERLAFMLEDANVTLLLTQLDVQQNLPSCQVRFLCLNGLVGQLASLSQKNLACRVEPKNLAYLIYTSGSTGRPKGAMNTHEAICNRLWWMQETYHLTESDRVLQKTPFSFDVSVWEFFWPLMTGACLVVARPEGHRDPTYLVHTIRERRITTVHFVPSMLQVFLEESGLESCHDMRRVICSGEALPIELQRCFFTRLDAELHNLYGPTEAAVDVTFWRCERASESQIVPIGHPIANTQAYLLNAQLQLVPIGVAGELHIGGIALARGYWHNAELTAERFIPDPFSQKRGGRLYKTGDLARFRSDGAIEYLGRIDRQVKIRGFRIELGEIEASILAHSAVRACVVTVRQGAALSKRLVAYVLADEEDQLRKNDLQQFLQGRLPDYMIPSSFIVLDAFPLTENGKIDYRRLEASPEEHEQGEGSLAPRTAIEKALASIWSEVLGVRKIGIRDSFFALGGDSILSIQVVSRARQVGLHLTPRHLFLYKTIEQLSTEVELAQPEMAEQGLVLGSVPLTPIQRWFFSHKIPSPHHWNQSFRLEVLDKLHWESLERALSTLLEHHDALRLRFSQRADGSWEQWYGELDAIAPFSWIDLSALPQVGQASALACIETEIQKSLNLSTGPLLRVVFCQLDRHSPAYLLFTIHHLAVDGVSWRILFEDLQVAYSQHIRQLPVHLPPKTSSYREWAEHLSLYAQTPSLKQELPYWLALIHRHAPEIPVDLPFHSEESREYTARTIFLSLPVAVTQLLLEEPLRLYDMQIQEVVIAALTQTFTNWTRGSTLLLDLEGHGREEIFQDVDIARTVGWFTSIFPVWLQLESYNSIEETLTTIKEQMRSIPGRGLGYGVLCYLCEEPAVVKALYAQLRPRILFNYLGRIDQLFSSSQMFGEVSPCHELTRDPQGRRSHLFEINCWVASRQLHIGWTYSENLHHARTVEQLATDFLTTLQRYAKYCELASSNRRYTTDDFSDMDLSQKQLEQILSIINRDAGGIDDEEADN